MESIANPSMDLQQIYETLRRLEAENESLRRERIPTEPHVSLPDKYDGSRGNCRAFLNQIQLVFRLQPSKYPDDKTRVGAIGTLLTGHAAAWFSPLFEQDSPLLYDLKAFKEEFEQTFGEFDRTSTAANRIRALKQGSSPVSKYAAEFRLLASDLAAWGEAALIDQFYRGLNDEVKDLLLTIALPQSLNEAVSQAVRCDNRLFERSQERKMRYQPSWPGREDVARSGPAPMEIDLAKQAARNDISKNAKEEERQRRRSNNLCYYCGDPGHMVKGCPKKSDNPVKRRARPL